MKVVLLQDVPKQGRKGDVIEVSEAYARNVLIRQNKAVQATEGVLKKIAQKSAQDQEAYNMEVEKYSEIAQKMVNSQFKFKLKSGPNGRAFGSISTKQIDELINSQFGLKLPKKNIHLDHDLNTFGTHIIEVKLHPEVIAQVKIIIEEE